MLKDENKPGYVAVDENEFCLGYAFCQLREQHVGEHLFSYVKEEAKRMGCYEVTLNVWLTSMGHKHIILLF